MKVDDNNQESIKAKIERMEAIFPGCFDAEGKLDIDLLTDELSLQNDITKESYEIKFLGKSYAKMVAGMDTNTMIEPDSDNNKKEFNINSQNIYINGDSLDALKHLVSAYKGRKDEKGRGFIRCIYVESLDNILGAEFTNIDNFDFNAHDLLEKLNLPEKDAIELYDMISGKISSHAALLTFLYSRLYLAWQLLSDDGLAFISADDSEQENVKKICDDIFGETQFVLQIAIKQPENFADGTECSNKKEYILCYAKDMEKVSIGKLPLSPRARREYIYNDQRGRFRRNMLLDRTRGRYYYPIKTNSGRVLNGPWMKSEEEFKRLDAAGLVYWPNGGDEIPYRKKYLDESNGQIPNDFWDIDNDEDLRRENVVDLFSIGEGKTFADANSVLTRLLSIGFDMNSKDLYVLDLFANSDDMARAVIQSNHEDGGTRKYILVQHTYNNSNDSTDLIEKLKTGCENCKDAFVKRHTDSSVGFLDVGFKHYSIQNPEANLITDMDHFSPKVMTCTPRKLCEQIGAETILTTWKVRDGFTFDSPVDTIDLKDNYTAYRCGDCLYLLHPGIKIDNLCCLIEKYVAKNKNYDVELSCHTIVIYGYSFTYNELMMMETNLKQIGNSSNVNVRIYVRY